MISVVMQGSSPGWSCEPPGRLARRVDRLVRLPAGQALAIGGGVVVAPGRLHPAAAVAAHRRAPDAPGRGRLGRRRPGGRVEGLTRGAVWPSIPLDLRYIRHRRNMR